MKTRLLTQNKCSHPVLHYFLIIVIIFLNFGYALQFHPGVLFETITSLVGIIIEKKMLQPLFNPSCLSQLTNQYQAVSKLSGKCKDCICRTKL